MVTFSLCVELDFTVNPPTVKDVYPLWLNGWPAYSPHLGYDPTDKATEGYYHGPRAILTEITTPSHAEAEQAMQGLIQSDPRLAWTLEFKGVNNWLHPPFGEGGSRSMLTQYKPLTLLKKHP